MTTKVYIPIMLIPSTNEAWLDELLAQLAQLTNVEVRLVSGAPSMREIFFRRYEVIRDTPEDCTHVWFVDPDDLINVAETQRIIDSLDNPEIHGVILKELSFDSTGGKEERWHCRSISRIKVAKYLSNLIYRVGLHGTYFTQKLAQSPKTVLHPNVSYYWRLHENQTHRERDL